MAAPQNPERFELRRQSDDLVYSFVRKARPDGTVGYQRQDQDFWIEHRPGWAGWLGIRRANPAAAAPGTCCRPPRAITRRKATG